MSKRIGILGASGCGKSMTLKSLAGIETPDWGRISVEGKVVYDSARKINWRPQKRKIGYLFQNYALFPNMLVETNIGAGLKKWGKEEKRRRDAHTLEIPEWGTVLTLEREVPEDMTHIGFRARDFLPVWGERKANCIAARAGSIAELPFERKYFIKGAADGAEEICWFVQRELLQVLERRGVPDYLQMPENKILLLK